MRAFRHLPSMRLLLVVCLAATAAHAQRTDTFTVDVQSSDSSSKTSSSSSSSSSRPSATSRARRSSGSGGRLSATSRSRTSVGGITGGNSTARGASADFVVVGGGTAGCVVAARLCEGMPHASVVLLERGRPRTEDEELLVRAQPIYTDIWDNPEVVQTIQSEPNPGLLGRRVTQLTGNTLGGTSAVVSVQWTKPPLATFDTPVWAFTGLDSTVAGDLYTRAERQLNVVQPPRAREQTYARDYLAAAEATGIPTDDDPLSRTGPVADGIWITPVAADRTGRRRDACTAYLTPVMGAGGACARNLRLEQSATVQSVVIERGRAVAVRYLKTDAPQGEQQREVAVKREVVSSAGPFGSPQLLQRSGVGSAEVLKRLGVDVAKELPARPASLLLDAYTSVPLAPEANSTLLFAPESIEAFEAGRGGVLAVSSGGTNGAIAEANSYTATLNIPLPTLPANLISAFCGITPTARGFIRARNTDPTSPPTVHTNFYGNSDDLDNAVACSKRLQGVRDALAPELGLVSILPGPQFGDQVSEQSVSATSDTFFHTVAGCALGEVVDGGFKVMGVRGLRVVDASVQPEMPPTAGPMSTVYMLAELASETIIAAHR